MIEAYFYAICFIFFLILWQTLFLTSILSYTQNWFTVIKIGTENPMAYHIVLYVILHIQLYCIVMYFNTYCNIYRNIQHISFHIYIL